MWLTLLVNKFGMYRSLRFINTLAVILAPFANTHLFAIDEGGGTAGEQEKLVNQIQEKIDAAKKDYESKLEEAMKGNLSAEEVKKSAEEVSKLSVEAVENKMYEENKKFRDEIVAINKTLETQGEELAKVSDKNVNTDKVHSKTIGDAILKEMEDKGLVVDSDQKDGFGNPIKMADVKDENKVTKLTFKAPIDMTTADAVRPGQTPGTNIGYLTSYNMETVRIPLTRDDHVVEGFPVKPTNQKYIGVVVYDNYEDGSGTTAENVNAGKSSFTIETKEFKVFDIVTIFKVAENTFDDIGEFQSEMNRIAPDKIWSKVDEKVLSKTGNGTTDIKGIRATGNFTEFDATTFAASVQNANEVDLAAKMRLQANLADEDVNAIWLHPTFIEKVEGLKDADNNDITLRRIVMENGRLTMLSGLRVMKSKKMDVNEAVAYNIMEAAEIGLRQDMEMIIGREERDISKNMVTIRFKVRVAFGVGKPSTVIYSDDVAADIGIIDNV